MGLNVAKTILNFFETQVKFNPVIKNLILAMFVFVKRYMKRTGLHLNFHDKYKNFNKIGHSSIH